MTFEYLVAIKVKNDGLTRELGVDELTTMLAERLLDNGARELPWVLEQDISVITRDLRE